MEQLLCGQLDVCKSATLFKSLNSRINKQKPVAQLPTLDDVIECIHLLAQHSGVHRQAQDHHRIKGVDKYNHEQNHENGSNNTIATMKNFNKKTDSNDAIVNDTHIANDQGRFNYNGKIKDGTMTAITTTTIETTLRLM